jgi:hypothetical protein
MNNLQQRQLEALLAQGGQAKLAMQLQLQQQQIREAQARALATALTAPHFKVSLCQPLCCVLVCDFSLADIIGVRTCGWSCACIAN